MLDLKPENIICEELTLRVGELEKALRDAKQAEDILHRQNEYLTALHETSLGLIDHLDKEELLEAVLQRAAMLTGTEHGYIYLLDLATEDQDLRRSFLENVAVNREIVRAYTEREQGTEL